VLVRPETHPDIYTKIDKALELCRAIPRVKLDKHVTFHCYWRGHFGPKQLILPKSYVATQDLNNTKLIIWASDIGIHLPSYMKQNVEIRKWRAHEEAVGTPLEGMYRLLSVRDELRYLESDLFRLITLYKYGGVYVDMDIVLLRDFSPLLDTEFVYQWGNSLSMVNNAVMYCEKNSEFILELLSKLIITKPLKNNSCWGTHLISDIAMRRSDIAIFPSAFFNTEWQLGISGSGLERHGPNEMYDGAFAWHWHNQWGFPIEPNSKLDKLINITDRILKDKFNVDNPNR
jgi:hypothetical protein